jgi:peptide-methionine (S)-S-oxide reductase
MNIKTSKIVPALALNLALGLFLAGCGAVVPSATSAGTNSSAASQQAAAVIPANAATAIFAGGCFWCMEKPFDQLPGVLSTTSGYTGGTLDNPTYHQVGGGGTGHVEAVKVVYDPARISYAQLLKTYWLQVDPFDGNGQFCDQGGTYIPEIFVANPTEQAAAETSKREIEGRFPGQTIAVKIVPAKTFWDAEGYHQDYYLKNPLRYAYYRNGCGRDARLRAVWGNEAAH